jgi:hypothetical protein
VLEIARGERGLRTMRGVRRFHQCATIVAIAAATLGFSACPKKKGEVVGSCDRRSKEDAISVCSDSFEKDSYLLKECGSGSVAGKASDKACDRTGTLVGCKQSDRIVWYFPSKSVRKIEHAASLCLGGTLISAANAELKGIASATPLTPAEIETEELVPQLKPKIDPKLAIIEQLGKKLPPPSTRVLSTNDEVSSNALLIHAEDLAQIGARAKIDHRAGGSQEISECVQLTRTKDPKDVKDVGKVLRTCAEAKHLIVLRMNSVTEPKTVTGLNSYTGGTASGDLLLYELTGGKLIGTAPFSAKSSTGLDTTWSKFEEDLRKDFDKQIKSARSQAASKMAPKGKIPL